MRLMLRDSVSDELTEVLSGTKDEFDAYATKYGYLWRKRPVEIYGGYWYHPDNGKTLEMIPAKTPVK